MQNCLQFPVKTIISTADIVCTQCIAVSCHSTSAGAHANVVEVYNYEKIQGLNGAFLTLENR